jgi:hypothetical protein
MAKKSKSSVKSEIKTTGEMETTAPVKELNVPAVEAGGIIDFYYFFNGIGVITGIIFILVGILRYVFHML